MRQIFPLGDYVRRTGDTMTGNLNLGDNAVVFTGGLIKNIYGYLDSRNVADTGFTGIRGNYYIVYNSVEGAGGTVITLKRARPLDITLPLIIALGRR